MNKSVIVKWVTDLPLKEEEVEVVVVLGKKIPKNTVWVATFDLVGWETKVDALDKVPQLSNSIPVESPEIGNIGGKWETTVNLNLY